MPRQHRWSLNLCKLLFGRLWDELDMVPTYPIDRDIFLAANYEQIMEIYNIILEESSTKGVSPEGTEWAIWDTSDIQNLTFNSFRNAVGSPKNVVGKKLVLHIIQENIYLPVEFISWGQGNSGSFSYKRTTQQ